jgi:hypothetical protein
LAQEEEIVRPKIVIFTDAVSGAASPNAKIGLSAALKHEMCEKAGLLPQDILYH